MLNTGDNVTVKVRNPLYDVRERYANQYIGPEFETYTGTVIRERWHGEDRVGLTTNQPGFPVRVLSLRNIVEVSGAVVDLTPQPTDDVTKVVQGSKGNSYIVTKIGGKVSCSCPGFKFRGTCRHIAEVM